MNTRINYTQAKKQPNGKYKSFWIGTINEIFYGELFDSVKQAKDYFRAMEIKWDIPE